MDKKEVEMDTNQADLDTKEVDPRLFVSCRLCLEETGTYQIFPTVQKQIKFCFDIDVDFFDGLPQLLCKKCKFLLSEFNTTKKAFLAKQESLKLRLSSEAESSIPQPEEDTKQVESKTKKRRRIVSSSSNTDSETDANKEKRTHEMPPAVVHHDHISDKQEKSTSWDISYTKLYVCRICNLSFKSKNDYLGHFQSHNDLKRRFPNFFSQTCTVNLNRVDDKPNLTGVRKAVVFSCDKITKQCLSNYHIMFVPLENHKKARCSSTQPSDNKAKTKKRNKTRLTSRSSCETIVIEESTAKLSEKSDDSNDGDKVVSNGVSDCISIDDSSDGGSVASEVSRKSKKKRKCVEPEADEATIKSILSICHDRYLATSSQSGQSKLREQLKHKVLSVGKKILHKRCFNSTGILRYMEWNDLKIVWLPKGTKQPSYVHAKIDTQKNTHNGAWNKIVADVSQDSVMENNGEVEHELNDGTSVELNQDSRVESTSELVIQNTFSFNKVTNDEDSAVIYSDESLYDIRNKLLNENPVANPKKLPKKLKQNAQSPSFENCPTMSNMLVEDEENNMCLPIIMSTKSLAENNTPDPKDASDVHNTSKEFQPSFVSSSQQVSAPRIKVKPVSELMSPSTPQNRFQDATNNITTSTIRSLLQVNNVSQPIPETYSESTSSQQTSTNHDGNSDNTPTATSEERASTNNDYIILDSVEMPNTRTSSPFSYFKSLLTLHNIRLLNVRQTLSSNFVCLIKFKVFYCQEAKQQPVIICLSLYSLRNQFCMKIMDKRQEYINIDSISPNWQWELLKLYKGNVVDKLLQNAMKVSQETYNFTQTFICVLKSISLVT